MHYKFSSLEVVLIILSALFVVWAVISLIVLTGWGPWFETNSLDHFGSFIGGVMALLNLYYLIRTLIEQHRQNALASFESNFLELVKFCRGQLAEIEIENPDSVNQVLRGKKAITCIFHQIVSAIEIVDGAIQGRDVKELYANEETFTHQQALWGDNHRNRVTINIAYTISYVGVKYPNCDLLKEKYLAEYEPNMVKEILTKFRMKLSQKAPEELRNAEGNALHKSDVLNCDEKYYQGFQNELGNYFRMLYQAVTFVDSHALTFQQKYKYVKMLRGQMSNMEECVLYYNSLSNFGLAWEKAQKEDNDGLITKYNLIKNIPNDFCKPNPNKFYPNVFYEYLASEPEGRRLKQYR